MIWTCRVVQNAICDIVPCFLFDGGVCMGIILEMCPNKGFQRAIGRRQQGCRPPRDELLRAW